MYKNNPLTASDNKVISAIDTCTCEAHIHHYGDGEVDIDIERFIACTQCREMELHDDVIGMGATAEAYGEVYAMSQDIEYGAFYAQRKFQGPLMPHQHDNRPRIQWCEPDDLSF